MIKLESRGVWRRLNAVNSQSRHGSDRFELTVTGDGDGRHGEDGFRRKLDCARSMEYTSESTLGAHTDEWSLPVSRNGKGKEGERRFESVSRRSGGHSGRETPVPIPNTEVKSASVGATTGVREPLGTLRRRPPIHIHTHTHARTRSEDINSCGRALIVFRPRATAVS